MFPDWNARVEFKDSTQAFFDGAKCMFKYYLNINKYNPPKNKKYITVISVKDYYSKASIDTVRAFLLFGAMCMDPWGWNPFLLKKKQMPGSSWKSIKARKF